MKNFMEGGNGWRYAKFSDDWTKYVGGEMFLNILAHTAATLR